MKSVGYAPEYAGAVECVASAGGQIMPPVMGAAAFLMAQFIGVQYSVIVFATIIPAFLYYLCVWVSVEVRARRQGLKTLEKDQIPKLGSTFRDYGHMAIPLIALIYFLSVKGYNPIYAAWLSILIAIVVSFFRKKRPPDTETVLPRTGKWSEGHYVGSDCLCLCRHCNWCDFSYRIWPCVLIEYF